jgi:hypothetical protein
MADMGSGDEVWAINSADVLAVDNTPEMTVLTERPMLTPGERGWVDPTHPDNQDSEEV